MTTHGTLILGALACSVGGSFGYAALDRKHVSGSLFALSCGFSTLGQILIGVFR